MLCGNQTLLSEPLQVSYTLYSSQNRPSEHPHASNTLSRSQNVLPELLQPSYMLCGNESGLSTNLLYALRQSKQTLRTSTSLLHTLRLSTQTLRSSTSLVHALTVSDGAWLTRGHHSRNHTYSLRNFMNNSLLYFKHFCMQGYKTDAPYLDKDDQDLYQSINRFILWLVVVNRQTHAVSTFRLAYLSNSCTR